MTDTGKAYYEQCCEILDRIDVVEQRAARTMTELHGRLRVSMPSSFGMRHIAPVLPAFLERHPNINLDVWCSDEFVDFPNHGSMSPFALRVKPTTT